MIDLETIFGGRGYANIPASPLQRAICRASEGRPIGPELLSDEEVLRHFGCERSAIGLCVPVLVEIVAGIRGGKSYLAACGGIRDALVADLSSLPSHEVARHAIVAPKLDNANATFRILVGIIHSSAILSAMVVGEPTNDAIRLRRPDGRVVEIVVVSADRGGVALRSRWLAGFCFDEVAGFGIESVGNAVNAEALLAAAEPRLLPRTQGRLISSPFGEQGLLWRLHREHFGKPGRILVAHAPTRAMNPSFPQETVDAIRARDPDTAAREYDALWTDAAFAYFDGATLRAARRAAPLERQPVPGVTYAAAWDAATRGNGWTLAVARSAPDGCVEVVLAREWRGSKVAPLSPKVVIGEVKEALAPYGVKSIYVDQWSVDALRDTASDAGLALVECAKAVSDDGFKTLHTKLANGKAELPPHDMVEQDLRGVRKVVTPTGARIDLPKTPDGRHCDFAPSVALATFFASKIENVAGIDAARVDPRTWRIPLGDVFALVAGTVHGSTAIAVVQWEEHRCGDAPDIVEGGEVRRNPVWFAPRRVLHVVVAEALPRQVHLAADRAELLARHFGASRLAICAGAGAYGDWRSSLPRRGVTCRDETKTNAADMEAGKARLASLIRAGEVMVDASVAATLASLERDADPRVAALIELGRLDALGLISGSPARRAYRIDREGGHFG